MAGGMHMAAQDCIGVSIGFKQDQYGDDGIDVSGAIAAMERGYSVEIVALTDELSQEAARILQERRLQSNPVRAATRRVVQCQEEEDSVKRSVVVGTPITKIILGMMPILTWLPKIRLKTLQPDLIAGLTVGVMVIPQSMSYANIAGLPYIYGMYSACVPTVVYAFFGQSRQLAVGPVAMVSLLVEAGLRGHLTEEECPAWYMPSDAIGGGELPPQSQLCPAPYVQLAILTSLVVGAMQLLAAILKLGFLVSFLGHPVTSGFTSGAAIIIGVSQVKYIVGYDVPKSQSIYTSIKNLIVRIDQLNFMTLLLGIAWLAFLITNKKMSQKFAKFRILGPLGPLISCALGIILIWQVPVLREKYNVGYVGKIPDDFLVPSLSWKFVDISKVLPTALSACLIGYMESIAIGKNLAAKHSYEIEAGQELLALGMSNLVGACFSCYPVTGSFSRSAVNNSTGALTQLSGLVTACVMLLTLAFLTELFYFLPQFALAAIVMSSVIPLVALGEARRLYRIKKQDFVLWVVAFLGTLFFGVLQGIAIAVMLSLAIVIYESVRPQITILWRIPGTTIYRNMKQESSGVFIPNVFICRIGSSMYFANASFIKDMLLAYVADLEEVNKTEYMVLEMTPVVSMDSTAVHVIHDIVSDFHGRGIQIAFAMVGNRVDKTLRKANLKRLIGEQWFFPTVNEAVHYCLRHQHTKRSLLMNSSTIDKSVTPSMLPKSVRTGTEIGFSNDLHHACTMVFISLVNDVPMIMSEITAVFKNNSITIVRAQIEPLNEQGAKHTYFLKCVKTDTKLTDFQIERLREELEVVILRHSDAGSPQGPQDGFIRNVSADSTDRRNERRINALEEALALEQEANRAIQEQLKIQGDRIDQFLAMHDANVPTHVDNRLVSSI